MLDVKELHEKIMYPTVQVRAAPAGGSGTVIAATPHDGEHLVYVLTNHHVIAGAVDQVEKWDSNAGRKVQVEVRSPVDVSFYSYRRMSKLDTQDSRMADIVAWDEPADMALLEMKTGRPPEYIATMLSKERIRDLCMGMQVLGCGCSLLHKPLLSPAGMISSLDERIENLAYWMTSSSIIFGNSGGGMYLAETGEFIGIPSRLDVTSIGFSANAMPFLNYIIPVSRVYALLNEWEYQFIYDPAHSYEECAKRRKKKQDELQRAWEHRWREERNIADGAGGSDGDEGEAASTEDVLKALEA